MTLPRLKLRLPHAPRLRPHAAAPVDLRARKPARRAIFGNAAIAAALLMLVLTGTALALTRDGTAPAKHAEPGTDDALAITFDGEAELDRIEARERIQTKDVAMRDDAEAHLASPEPKTSKRHRKAKLPAASTTSKPADGVATAADVRKQLKSGKAGTGKLELRPDGTAVAPVDAPPEIHEIVAAANTIAKFPYRWGGGHGSFEDDAYDCSGSLSYALVAAGLVTTTLVSGQLAEWGEEGPGKWLTVYAHGGHTYMVVGGLRYDTSMRDGPRGSRWQTKTRSTDGFEVRHWPGL